MKRQKQLGVEFLEGLATVKKFVYVYNNQIIGTSGGEISVDAVSA